MDGLWPADPRVLPAVVIFSAVAVLLWLRGPKARVNDVPMPPGLPIIGNLLTAWRHDHRRLDASVDFTEQLGECWGFTIPFQRFVLVSSPRNVQHILKERFSSYVKGTRLRAIMREVLGDGIFNVDGAHWRVQRKAASHMFSVNELRGFMCSTFLRHLAPVAARVDAHEGRPFDIHQLFHSLTLGAITEIAFGVSCTEGGTFAQHFDAGIEHTTQRFFSPWYRLTKWVTPREFALRHSVTQLDRFAHEVIRAKRNTPMSALNANDVLSRFMQLRDENGQPYSDKYLRDVIMSFVIAGRDTTAQALSWMTYRLCRHPEVQRRVVEEVDAVLGGATPSYEGVAGLRYTTAVMREVLRLHPPVPIDLKYALEDDVLPSGHHIKKGDLVGYLPYAQARREEVWGADAKEFKPERWLAMDALPSPFKYPVFQAGPRTCLGQRMAELEIRVVIAYLLQRYTFAMEPEDQNVTYANTITLKMKEGLKVVATCR